MKNPCYHLSISVSRTPEEAFESLTNGLSDWWTDSIAGLHSEVGDIFTVHFGSTMKTMRIDELIPNEKIVWKCIKAFINLPGLSNKSEWEGTTISWMIHQEDGETKIRMRHEGLTPEIECYGVCEKGWNFYIAESLKSYLAVGQGQPFHQAQPV